MSDYERQVEKFINGYISSLMAIDEDDLPQHLLKDEVKFFDGKKLVVNSWIEELPDGKLLAVEIEKNTFYGKKVFSQGIRINGSKRAVVSQEEMWGLGLG